MLRNKTISDQPSPSSRCGDHRQLPDQREVVLRRVPDLVGGAELCGQRGDIISLTSGQGGQRRDAVQGLLYQVQLEDRIGGRRAIQVSATCPDKDMRSTYLILLLQPFSAHLEHLSKIRKREAVTTQTLLNSGYAGLTQ